MITPALKRMAENSEFKFCVENAMNLYEYLESHPDSFDEIKKFTEIWSTGVGSKLQSTLRRDVRW